MSDPERPDPRNEPSEPPAPSPFDRPGGPGTAGGATGPGVGKPLLIGCGALLVLLIVAGVLFVAYENAIFAWFLEVVQSEVEPLVPKDLPAAERERFEGAFARAIAATRAGRADPIAIQKAFQQLQRGITAAAEQGEKARLSPAAVADVTEALEAIPSGGGSPAREPPGPGAGTAPPG